MFSKKIVLSLAVMAAMLAATATTALATTPDCTTGRNLRGYNAGYAAGGSIVRQAWNGIGQDVDQFDAFMDTVHTIVATAIAGLPNDASDFVKCRAKGLGQGVCDELGEIQGGVAGVCLLDGQIWGDLSAELYCALSIEFNGQDVLGLLPTVPTGVCGINFEAGCQSQFAFAATSYAACASYTVDPFDDVFADWQVGMCIYELP